MSNARFLAKGIRATNDKIQFNVDAKVDSDNARDFGSGGARWKDLYLSGGAYIGGTGSSNYFDDYEEGLHTPVLTGYTTGSGTTMPLSSNHNVLSYTKIGRQVTVTGKVETSGSHSASGYLRCSLPFVVADLDKVSGSGAGNTFFYRTGDGLHYNATAIPSETNSHVLFYQNTSGGDVNTINAQDMDSAIEFFITVTYFTT